MPRNHPLAHFPLDGVSKERVRDFRVFLSAFGGDGQIAVRQCVPACVLMHEMRRSDSLRELDRVCRRQSVSMGRDIKRRNAKSKTPPNRKRSASQEVKTAEGMKSSRRH